MEIRFKFSAQIKVNWSSLLRAMSCWLLRISKNQDFITFLGNLFQCLTTLMIKMFLLMFSYKQCMSVVACPSLRAPLRRVCLLLLTPLIRYSYASVRFPQSPLFSRLNNCSCLSQCALSCSCLLGLGRAPSQGCALWAVFQGFLALCSRGFWLWVRDHRQRSHVPWDCLGSNPSASSRDPVGALVGAAGRGSACGARGGPCLAGAG